MLIVDTLKTLLSEVVSPLDVASLMAKVPAKVESASFKVMTVSIYSVTLVSEHTHVEWAGLNETYGEQRRCRCKRPPGILQPFPNPRRSRSLEHSDQRCPITSTPGEYLLVERVDTTSPFIATV